jgi:site-specific recombinase XerD
MAMDRIVEFCADAEIRGMATCTIGRYRRNLLAAQAASIEGVHPHVFRHWLTTLLRRAGMRREYILWIRGDAIRDAIDIYFHIYPKGVRENYLACVPPLGGLNMR